MTKEEIHEMKSGPEMDLLILEKVMGWKRVPRPEHWVCSATFGLENAGGDSCCPVCQLPSYSEAYSMEASWMVVEKMMAKGYNYTIRGNFEGNGKHWCGFDHQEWADSNPLFKSPLCDTLPLAICKAALIAIAEDAKGDTP